MLDKADDQFEILFKYYETLKMYEGNLNDLTNTINIFNDD